MSTYVYVDGEADAFRGGAHGAGRKPVQRRTVDYTATTVRHIEVRGDLARDPATTRARPSLTRAQSVGPRVRARREPVSLGDARPTRRARGVSVATTARFTPDHPPD